MESSPSITDRDPSLRETDASALRALAQAAINVELFTIPLYMAGMYSLQGMHEINAKKQTFYKGRQWPGASRKANPSSDNERAFNILFSVFIQEMLHLQLAANLASGMGAKPCFTSDILLNKQGGWKCYGPEETVIPHIIDLRDTTTYGDIKVQLGALDADRIKLFLAIEEPEGKARERLKPEARGKYFPSVPFKGWTQDKGVADLPLFGTIGHMYECMAKYMNIRYSDGETLWDYVYRPGSVQRDLFNSTSSGHPMPEYSGFATVLPTGASQETLRAALDMINAITDQGEGRDVSKKLRAMFPVAGVQNLSEVKPRYQSSEEALKAAYPSYDANGEPAPSADAAARYRNDQADHYERFLKIQKLQPELVTWPMWHAQRGAEPWKAEDLLTGDITCSSSSQIPSAGDVAAALNRLKARNVAENGSVHRQLSHVAVGAIAGITQVLDEYWVGKVDEFPFPSMSGSGDRMAICWATLGEAPDLSLGIEQAEAGTLYHACQGLSLERPGSGEMPHISTYHSCRGSNACKGQGGCGFVQPVEGGGSCGMTLKSQVLCGGGGEEGTLYSAPGDNCCRGFGGCAVPISASQVFPRSGTMQLYDIEANRKECIRIGTQPFKEGDSVYEIAWEAYCKVLLHRKQPVPEKPKADDLRLAFPPST